MNHNESLCLRFIHSLHETLETDGHGFHTSVSFVSELGESIGLIQKYFKQKTLRSCKINTFHSFFEHRTEPRVYALHSVGKILFYAIINVR